MHDKKSPKKITVLGAGISGLTAAYALSKRGHRVTVLEKNDYVGGLAATFSYKNHLLDYGPHNFHTHIPATFNFIKDELDIPMKKMPISSSKLFFMGKFVNYPLKINDALKNLSLGVSMRSFLDYLVSRVALKFDPRDHTGSFEDWVKSRFGGYIYDLYFGPYVKKVWGIPGYELDAVVAKKRIPEPSLFSLLIRALTGMRHGKKHSEDPEDIESYYPSKGIGVISERLKERILDNKGVIELNCRIDSITANNAGGDKGITYTANGVTRAIEWDSVISTIPINSLFSTLSVPLAGDAAKYASALPYRSIILLYMLLSVEKVFDAPWIYFNEKDNPDLIFNRMYEIGNFSPEMIHNKNGVICLEITCYKGDSIWNKSDKELFDITIAYLEKNGFLNRNSVQDILTKRLEVAYPVFRKGYQLDLRDILRFLIDRGDIFPIGRQGLFSYANVDHCIDMGLRSAQLFEPASDPQDFYRIYKDYLF